MNRKRAARKRKAARRKERARRQLGLAAQSVAIILRDNMLKSIDEALAEGFFDLLNRPSQMSGLVSPWTGTVVVRKP